MVMVCVDDPRVTDRIVELVSEHFPSCRLLVRSYDRGHSIRLRKAGVDFEMRETFESALAFGGAGLRALGVTALDVSEVADDVRRRDGERLDLQAQQGLLAGGDKLHVEPRPEPLIPPRNRATGIQS
jgi:glutathione-regulated potassium-efflux system protein KefB